MLAFLCERPKLTIFPVSLKLLKVPTLDLAQLMRLAAMPKLRGPKFPRTQFSPHAKFPAESIISNNLLAVTDYKPIQIRIEVERWRHFRFAGALAVEFHYSPRGIDEKLSIYNFQTVEDRGLANVELDKESVGEHRMEEAFTQDDATKRRRPFPIRSYNNRSVWFRINAKCCIQFITLIFQQSTATELHRHASRRSLQTINVKNLPV